MSKKAANLLFTNLNQDETMGAIFLQLPEGSKYETWSPSPNGSITDSEGNPVVTGGARGFEFTLVGENGEGSLSYKEKFEHYKVQTGTILLRYYNSPKDEAGNPIGVFAFHPSGYITSPQTIEYDRKAGELEERIKQLETKTQEQD